MSPSQLVWCCLLSLVVDIIRSAISLVKIAEYANVVLNYVTKDSNRADADIGGPSAVYSPMDQSSLGTRDKWSTVGKAQTQKELKTRGPELKGHPLFWPKKKGSPIKACKAQH